MFWQNFPINDAISYEQEMLAAYDFNIRWYEKAARLYRGLHYGLGIAIVLGQVAMLSSFGSPQSFTGLTSKTIVISTSALLALFAFLSPTEKWRTFRAAQFELLAQRLLFRMEVDLAPDPPSKHAVTVKYMDLGMRVINAAASSYWRQVGKSAQQLKAEKLPDPAGNGVGGSSAQPPQH